MHPRINSGFTLIELMVTIVVAAALLTVAVPSFREMFARNELITVTNAWVGAINTARAEAVKRNQIVVLCGESGRPSSGIGSGCSAALAGQVRYMPRNSGTVEVLHAALADSVGQSLELVSSATVRFRGDGVGYPGNNMMSPYNTASGDEPSVVVLCNSMLSTDNARLVQLLAGSTVRVVTATRPDCS